MENLKLKLDKPNKRTQGYYLDLISSFLTVNNNVVQNFKISSIMEGQNPVWSNAPDLCLVPGLSLLISISHWGVLNSLFLPLPPPPFLSFSEPPTKAHTQTHQCFLSCGSLINDRLSGKWHLWWLQHFWRTFFFQLRGKDANEGAHFRVRHSYCSDYRSWYRSS